MSSDKHYKKNFLTDVVFRIDYPIILDLVEDQPKSFQKEIMEKFPILEPIKSFGFKIEKQAQGMTIETQNLEKLTWNFKSKDNKKIIELDPEYLAIVLKKYNCYTEFKNLIKEITEIFYKNYPMKVINRLGLRYTNQIEIQEGGLFNWNKYINSHLVKNLEFIKSKKQIRRVMNSFILFIDDETILNFKYGILSSVFPNKITSKEFFLDYDCYTKTKLEREDILRRTNKFNKINTDYFEKSITKDFRIILNK